MDALKHWMNRGWLGSLVGMPRERLGHALEFGLQSTQLFCLGQLAMAPFSRLHGLLDPLVKSVGAAPIGSPHRPPCSVGGHTNPVRLRWLLSLAVRSRAPQAGKIINTNHPKFDVRVQVRSNAGVISVSVQKLPPSDKGYPSVQQAAQGGRWAPPLSSSHLQGQV